MRRTVRIEVSQEDITRGIPGECDACPIALAAARAGLERPRIFSDRMHFGPQTESGVRPRLDLPKIAQAFIFDFDEEEPVSPFAFDLELP